MRLNRYLASCGYGSRRACEALILEGRVTVNGKTISDLATAVEPNDSVRVGKKLLKPLPLTYLVLYKPRGYVCTRPKRESEKTIYSLLPPLYQHLAHVGRLDKDSEGLLLLTNDGTLAHRLTHPSRSIPKTYVVQLDKPFQPDHLPKLLKGFPIEGGRAKMEKVHLISPTKLEIVLTQGINRQIRKMLWRFEYNVKRLTRTHIGSLHEPTAKPGQYRILRKREINSLLQDS